MISKHLFYINDVDDVMLEWRAFVAEEKERQLSAIIREENLNSVKTSGTAIDKLLPPMSRFGGGNRAEKKQGVIDKLKTFFERFFGIG